MKQFLILLSSITTLTISSITFANFNQNTTVTNNLQTNNNNNQTALFNNKYRYLSDSDIITNQSIIDNKYYSYDTSALKNYSFANARNIFLVNNTGSLVYNPAITIPDKDKVDIGNTMQEMISNKKVTTIKNEYNLYSKSEYSNLYFSGDNHNWQYIQQGGVETHIDISQQAGANKVEYSNSLSESLGLYYIAKAEINNKIDKSIAEQLSKYFINQSSLKGQISDKLTTTIVNLIINNQEIYNFLYNSPMQLTAKNYSLNWIFDENNNLIDIYYNTWNKNNIENNLDYYWSDSYSWSNDNSGTYKLLKWTEYSKNWDEFLKIYPTFKFNQSSLSLSGGSQTHSEDVSESFSNNSNTNKILNNQGSGNTNSLYHLNIYMGHDSSQYPVDGYANLDLNIWHDNENIYFKWFFTRSGDGTADISIKLVNINFINIMN
ncbi:hypothetical protein [Spiroplasma endosymbiont of Polydrusus pterygomalis]|uniref:hypothetical protein n=1 Tax=Spiroplasma endosymbiont of Polydrusus pterygomalis TaxID=3139327 RepID=UPI003CCB2E2F